jgi:hypothetical protein
VLFDLVCDRVGEQDFVAVGCTPSSKILRLEPLPIFVSLAEFLDSCSGLFPRLWAVMLVMSDSVRFTFDFLGCPCPPEQTEDIASSPEIESALWALGVVAQFIFARAKEGASYGFLN